MKPLMCDPALTFLLLAHCPFVLSCAQSSLPPLGSFDCVLQFVYTTGAPSAHTHKLSSAHSEEAAHVGPWKPM